MLNRNSIQLHPYHIVSVSPWPLLTSFTLLNLTVGGVLCFHGALYGNLAVSLGFISTAIAIAIWFRDVASEGTYLGAHTLPVQSGLSWGFYLFVLTEVIFFVSLFWAYLHSALSPTVELGSQWPPVGVSAIEPFTLPLLNTFLLLGSGASVTYSHHALLGGDRRGAILGLIITILLALLFTACQALEYYSCEYTIVDSVYGSSFFLATGFHGLHIIIGTCFLCTCLWRLISYQHTQQHHLGTEIGILYWHLVDVVWLILFALIYVWASL